jgi:hypothetical protein
MAKTLLEKAMACHQFIHARHYYEGQIRSHVILPPAGLPDWSTGNHESDALATGMHLQAMSFWWAATKDPKAKAEAKETARGLRKLQRVTGTKACFARGSKRAEGPTWDEQMHFFPREWHQAGKYRWVGDPSTDSLVGLMGGYQAYFELVADQKEKAEVAKDVDRIMGRIVDANMCILDVDGRMTLWGNMCPVILEENLNALEALSHLRAAYRMTKKRRYLNEYYRLIEEHDYQKKAALANAQASPPRRTMTGIWRSRRSMRCCTMRRMRNCCATTTGRWRCSGTARTKPGCTSPSSTGLAERFVRRRRCGRRRWSGCVRSR